MNSQFARLYHARTGESPIHTIDRGRLKRAVALFDGSDLPVKAVARLLGFVHAGAFSIAFRRITEMGPDRWRQMRHTTPDGD